MKNTLPALLYTIGVLTFPSAALAANQGDFSGAVAIGTGYAGIDAAPTNGLIVQGNVGIGTTVPAAPLDVRAAGDNAYFYRYTSDIYAPILRFRKARGTITSPTAIQNGDTSGVVSFEGYDGSAYQLGASITGIVNGTVASGSVPTDITFDTGSSYPPPERMRITNGGNVGIGTTAPVEAMDVVGSLGGNISTDGDASQLYGYYTNSSTYGGGVRFNEYNSNYSGSDTFTRAGYAGLLTFNEGIWKLETSNASGTAGGTITYINPITVPTNGDVGISNTSPSYLLHVGSSSASGAVAGFQNSADLCTLTPASSTPSWSCSSDVRLKTDIADTGDALAWLRGVRVRDFSMKATGERQTGVIAQELATTHPDMVRIGANGFLAVDSPNPWVLIKAIQEQQKEIDELKHKIEQKAGAQ
jgi:hypothetical protein